MVQAFTNLFLKYHNSLLTVLFVSSINISLMAARIIPLKQTNKQTPDDIIYMSVQNSAMAITDTE